MANRPNPPSAYDVARLAGVSQAAVSRAFTPGASIADATREKVLLAAKELGYRPNLLARSLMKGRSGMVGVVAGNPRSSFFLYALDVLSSHLSEASQHLLLFTITSDTPADTFVEDLLQFRIDALILMSTSLSSELTEQCRREGIPVVFFNRRGQIDNGFPSVTGANFKGAGEIAQHLLEQGYRKPAFIRGLADSSTSREREIGFTAHLVSQGLELPVCVDGYFEREGAIQAMRELMSMPSPPDAVFCANDIMAFAAMEVAQFDFGLKVGRDVGIAGFDDVENAGWRMIDLTTYSQPADEMVEKVIEVLRNPERFGDQQIVVEGELKVRGSTRRS